MRIGGYSCVLFGAGVREYAAGAGYYGVVFSGDFYGFDRRLFLVLESFGVFPIMSFSFMEFYGASGV